MKFATVFCGVSLFLVPGLFPKNLPAQEETAPCSSETIAPCYTRALELYRDKNYPAAKSLFEQIIAIDVNYKAASRYLKKTENQLAKIKAEPQKEASKQQKGDEDFFDRQKDEMEEAGRVPLETEIPAEAVYRIDVGDILSVSVWRNEDLDKNVVVRPDGVISYPLVGDVPAVGLTLVELDNQLTAALTEFIRNPVVSVAVERFGGVKVIALGEVAGQGILSLPGGGTVIDVIALSGGFTRDAVRRSTFLIRGGMKNPQVYRLNLARIFKGDLSQNVAIQSNDIIYVPKTFIAHFNDAINRVSPLLSNMLLGTSVGRDLGLLDR